MWRAPVFLVGALLWVLSCLLLIFWLDLATEAMLVPWYCCDPDALPPPGTWQRTLNDFFAAFPGRILPALVFIVIEGLIFRTRGKQAGDRTWLPILFFGANILLFLVSMVATDLTWWLSNTLVGLRVGGIDAGYHRTWYGITSHLALWILFLAALAKIRLPGDWRQSMPTRRP